MKQIYIDYIANLLSVKTFQIENCIILLNEGCTIPFISRYRKEKTGGLDDGSVAQVKHYLYVFEEMEKRKEYILKTIDGLGLLTEELIRKIDTCLDANQLEDIYLPYKPKRKTKASIAKELGLEPLAKLMWDCNSVNIIKDASRFINNKVVDTDKALGGARDIFAEWLSETATVRECLRGIFRKRSIITKVTKQGLSEDEGQKYKTYFDYTEPLYKIAPHRLLAILRAENQGFLNVKIDVDAQKCGNKLMYDFCQEKKYPKGELSNQIRLAIDDAFSRLLYPSISTEIIKEYKHKADIESIKVFGDNLQQLLLAPPIGQKRTLAIDPGFRNGCKLACLSREGDLLYHTIIYPHPPQNKKVQAMEQMHNILEQYNIEAIAIGNGTASRETEAFIKMLSLPKGCKVFTVNEDGASIYSASDVAREEFPNEDVTVRGAVSIGRRLMDPLAELVKIDPKSLGVGQYQWDVDQVLLKEKLDNIVVLCVNNIGVNLNTASPYLLGYISGIGPGIAKNIVAYRQENGGFNNRVELKKVPRLGNKAYEQCAGFMRIVGGENPLDNTAIHPESYGIVEKICADLNISLHNLIGNEIQIQKIDATKYITNDIGLPTINDIIKELLKPSRDPRQEATEFAFAEDIKEIADLVVGMQLPGIVNNITAFGAFVDIGLHENGLIHISQMGVDTYNISPSQILKLHQKVIVKVVNIEEDRGRISLSLISKL